MKIYNTKKRISTLLLPLLCLCLSQSCGNKACSGDKCCQKKTTLLTPGAEGKNSTGVEAGLSCKLTSPELQKRKQTVIARLKTRVLDKKELKDGYSFRFTGSDENIDLLGDFVQSERQCCGFFVFRMNIESAETIWFDITGPEGVKDFISTELEM